MDTQLLKQLFPLPLSRDLLAEVQSGEPFPCFGRCTDSQARPILVEALRSGATPDIIADSYYQLVAEAVEEAVEDDLVPLSSFEAVARRMSVMVSPLGHSQVVELDINFNER